MFNKCKLLLSQGVNSAEIVLNRVAGSAAREGMTFWGAFTSTGGNIPEERRGWVFAYAKWECRLLDAGGPGVGMIGGGMDYHQLAPLEPDAILSGAVMTARGIEPMNGDTAQGRIVNSFGFPPLNSGPITWTLVGFVPPGTFVWKPA